MIAFTVPGAPQGKGRARVGKIAGRARMFTPEKTVAYEVLVAHAAQHAMAGQALLDEPVACNVFLDCPVPASCSARHWLARCCRRQSLTPTTWSRRCSTG